MNAIRHLLLRASAGTGKTHQLSNRYLALLLRGADPETILATTFTRKAAYEILERILKRLADGARGKAEFAGLEAEIGRVPTPEECLDHLARLLRGLDRLRVGTIDAFFAQLARLFALDVGLPAGWRIADDAERDVLVSEAVGEAIAGAESLELVELLRDFQKQAAERSVHEVLVAFGDRGRTILLDSTERAWDRIQPLPDAPAEEFATAVASLATMRLPKTKAGAENARWTKCRAALVECVERKAWLDVLEIGLAGKVCAGETSFDRHPIDTDHAEILRPIVAHALHVVTTRLASQNRAARALLVKHERSYELLSRGQGLLQFQDLPNALAPRAARDRSGTLGDELAHRLDGRIAHLLLDEFQDTAPVQWRVLRPIADGILADATGTKSFFCVGDEKQSIYGWRDAEPELLRGLGSKRPNLVPDEIHASYRSSLAVLETVNEVFGTLGGNGAFTDSKGEERTAGVAAREFQSRFVRHEPARDRPGAVFLLRAPPATDASPKPTLTLAVERVRQIVTDAPRARIGILMRTRKWIPELIHRLRVAGFAASDEGGNPLTDSQAVLQALSLLHLADHPGDDAAAFHVATSPLGAKVGLDPASIDGPAAARTVRAQIAELGYGGFLASIRPVESDGYGAWDVRRFGQLVDLAFAWEARAGSRPGAFVAHVRKTKVEDPTAAQVRVMTVHGSKGLEFDAVILPELDGSLTRREEGLMTLRPDPEGPIGTVTHALARSLSAAHPELEVVRADVVRRRATEALCVLYVAMTRAVHRLDLIVETPGKRSAGLTYASILRGALGVAPIGAEVEAWKHAENRTPWFRDEIARTSEPEAARRPAIRLRFAPSRRARALPSLSPSRAKEVGVLEATRLLQPSGSVTARGRILHKLLEQVEWIDDFDASDESLVAIGRRIEPDLALVRAAVEEFRAVLARPDMRAILAKPGDDAQAWREKPFALVMPGPDGVDSLWSGAFDRVVVRFSDGKPASGEIVDFKTDRVEPDAVRARAETYRAQMEAYRRALARTTGLRGGSIATSLLFLGRDFVEKVPV